MMRHLAIVREIRTGSDHAGQETRVGAIEALEHPEATLEQDVVRMGWRECSRLRMPVQGICAELWFGPVRQLRAQLHRPLLTRE